MLDKAKIVKSALIKLGNTSSYNDNSTEETLIALYLLDEIIDQLAYNTKFLFNAKTVKLNKTTVELEYLKGELQFYKPVGFLNLIHADSARMEGDYFYSKNEELVIQYCESIRFTKFPDYLERLLTFSLAFELCNSFSQYQDKMGLFADLLAAEYDAVLSNETDNTVNYIDDLRKGMVI